MNKKSLAQLIVSALLIYLGGCTYSPFKNKYETEAQVEQEWDDYKSATLQKVAVLNNDVQNQADVVDSLSKQLSGDKNAAAAFTTSIGQAFSGTSGPVTPTVDALLGLAIVALFQDNRRQDRTLDIKKSEDSDGVDLTGNASNPATPSPTVRIAPVIPTPPPTQESTATPATPAKPTAAANSFNTTELELTLTAPKAASGDQFAITGDGDLLSHWHWDWAPKLNQLADGVYAIRLTLPLGDMMRYKYVRIRNGVETWEYDPNRTITPNRATQTQNDQWNGPN